MHGKGEFIWLDGRHFIGEYKFDKKNGYGEFEWPDGRVYKGMWKDGRQHGEGKYLNSRGKLKEGIWVNGRRQKSDMSQIDSASERQFDSKYLDELSIDEDSKLA